jgi:hypothetical protein
LISKKLRETLETEVKLAPSAHNTQPWSLRFESDALILVEDPSRRLHAADPNLKDQMTALGCSIEGIDLILREFDLKVQSVVEIQKTPGLLYGLTLGKSTEFDSLRLQITERKTYRGVFKPTPSDQLQKLKHSLDLNGHFIADDPKTIAKVAELACLGSLACNRTPGVQSEFFDWLRLSSAHPRFDQDGLNFEALALTRLEAFAASWLLRPHVYRFLDRKGLAAFLNSEKAQICSSAAIVVLTQPDSHEDSIEFGRRVYRTWLKLTELGFAACPQSSLVDDPETKMKLKRLLNQTQDPAFVLRVGRARKEDLPPRIRLSE